MRNGVNFKFTPKKSDQWITIWWIWIGTSTSNIHLLQFKMIKSFVETQTLILVHHSGLIPKRNCLTLASALLPFYQIKYPGTVEDAADTNLDLTSGHKECMSHIIITWVWQHKSHLMTHIAPIYMAHKSCVCQKPWDIWLVDENTQNLWFQSPDLLVQLPICLTLSDWWGSAVKEKKGKI